VIRDDYLMRLIKQLAEFVSRIAGYRRAGRLDDAQDEAERAWSELFDIPRELALVLDTPTLAGMLREPERMRAAARLSWEEGRILTAQGDPLNAAGRYRRAFELYLEARAIAPSEEDDDAVLELSRVIPAAEIDPRYRV
jgi:tetratricopeptide (TPR) repeat protein